MLLASRLAEKSSLAAPSELIVRCSCETLKIPQFGGLFKAKTNFCREPDCGKVTGTSTGQPPKCGIYPDTGCCLVRARIMQMKSYEVLDSR